MTTGVSVYMETARTLLAQARLSFQHDRVNDAARYAYLAVLQAAQAYVARQGDAPSHMLHSQTSDELMACFARFAKADPRLVEPELSYHLHRTAQLKAQYDVEPPPTSSSDLARIEDSIASAARFVDGVGRVMMEIQEMCHPRVNGDPVARVPSALLRSFAGLGTRPGEARRAKTGCGPSESCVAWTRDTGFPLSRE